ncbi:hypothetical protein CRE_24610 [Caenorhabditis remanei]|uniref:F-box domain-containing protein n=1 Tax=Caenorhabditis remanei TaxID=31234 RepID=E3MVF5_CAERE|nr:hypothetical protein CRE_24610 [Caenorhabditis remanei]
MVYITFLYCHSCTRATVKQDDKAIPYDCDTRRPCIGSCGHSICEICVTDRSDKSCPICHQENSFKTKPINYFALPIIEDYQNKAWENMKGLWRGSTRALCEDCLQTHHPGHQFSRIMTLSAPQHNIKKTTADVIYALFENWMEKTQGFINCELRRARIYYNCGLLENQALGMPRGKCGWFRAKIKAEINKNLIENIEKQVENWRNGKGPNPDETLRNSKCECVRIYEELKDLGYEQDISKCYQKLLKGERKKRTGTMISDIQGCPLYFDFNQKRRDKLSDWGYQRRPSQCTAHSKGLCRRPWVRRWIRQFLSLRNLSIEQRFSLFTNCHSFASFVAMSNGVRSFPLLCLPNECLKYIVQCMEEIDKFAISLVSKRSQSLITSTKLKCLEINIYVRQAVSICIVLPSHKELICSFENYQVQLDNLSPWNIKANVFLQQREEFIHNKPSYRFEDWLNHILGVYECCGVETVIFDRLLPNLLTFKKTIKCFSHLVLSETYSDVQIRDIFKTLRPEKEVYLGLPTFENKNEGSECIHEVFMQNFDEIILSRWTDVTLDDLLVMNSKEINIRSARVIDEKILNRFIKHWIAGSNKRMKYLGLATQNRITIDRAAVLKGIRHVLVPKECRRFFKDTPSLKHSIEGGYDFKRKDGTTGTIVFDRFEYFQLFVWP